MPIGHYLLALFCVFATSFARKSQDEWVNNEWPISNTMSKENGEQHDPARYPDTIDIDNNQGWSAENSRASNWPSSGAGIAEDSLPQDEEWSSGWGSDDDDNDGGWGNNRGRNNGRTDDPYSGNGKPPYGPKVRPKPGGGPPDKVVVPDPNSPGNPYDNGITYEEPGKEDPGDVEIKNVDGEEEDSKEDPPAETPPDQGHRSSIIGTPGLLPGIIGGAVVGLLCAVLLVMFIVYRMRKKDEGSYALEEPKMTSPSRGYTRAPTKEYWA